MKWSERIFSITMISSHEDVWGRLWHRSLVDV